MARASDIVSDDDVRAVVEKVRNKYYQFRTLFRDHDGTGLNSNSFDFPVTDFEFEDEFVEIPAGSDYPRATKDYDTVQAVYTKYGVEVVLTDEDVDDSAIDIAMDTNEDLIEAEEQRLDAIAGNLVLENYGNEGDEIGDADGTIEFSDIVEGRQTLFYDADADLPSVVMVASGLNMANLLTMDEFTQASELGDQVLEQGILPGGDMVGQGFAGVAGDVPVYLENVGILDEGEAVMVDTSNYGWESERWATDVEQYREQEKKQDVWQVDWRGDFVSTNPDSAVKLEA